MGILSEAVASGLMKFYKNGIEIEKGAVLTPERVEAHRSLYEFYYNFFTAYPDKFIDLITPEDHPFEIFFYQRIFLRACMRYRYHYCCAPRAFSKSFISILALVLKGIFQPGIKMFICAPGKEQSAKIAKEKLTEIFERWPILRREIVGYQLCAQGEPPGNYGKDYIKLTYFNGSVLDVVGALQTTRGGRRNAGLIDEVRKIYSIKMIAHLKPF